ncbi:hypothetical protein [Fibrobacter sp. UWB5]|jgi:hypothetical protein|uniref:hypothetical protein n=1 Tax=Fibrobacter sp. UWB5 TaxID=1964360 RepID=UPI000B52702E|nr:hypothetical protein [Fibrobacter sp. UWB5]OWV09451.1 hypothetical protein B7989_13280 [Fibrobacter sp. UWB5]
MNQQIADIALMMVLPLGITFTAILMSVSAETRTKIMMGVFLSFLIVAMDCVFFFAKNSFIAYNCDGGLLLSFASLFFFAIISFIRFDDRAAKVGNIFLAFFMLSAFMGIAYWDRPTFIPTSDYTAEEIAAMNTKYQDYIASFQNGEGGQILPGSDHMARHRIRTGGQAGKAGSDDKDLSRLDSYLVDAETVIKRMQDIINAMDAFGTLPSSISESERETRSSQALAINNNAIALNKKVLGLFHPHESSDAHKELIQASECVRLAAYALYSYTLQENPEQQLILYRQSRDQIGQMKIYLKRFWNATEALQSNNQQQTEQ